MSWNQNIKHQIIKWVMKAREFPVLLRVSNMDIPYATQWNGGKSQTPRTDHMLYNSKGTMATVFHVKSVPRNCVMHILVRGFSCSQTGRFLVVASIWVLLPSHLLSRNCHSKPRWGMKSLLTKITSLGVFFYLMRSSTEILLTALVSTSLIYPMCDTILLNSSPSWSLNQSERVLKLCSRVSERVSIPSQLLQPFSSSSVIEVSTEKESIYFISRFGLGFVFYFLFFGGGQGGRESNLTI